MRTRSRNPFTTINTSGLLLPADLLARVAEGDADLKGLAPKDYHLQGGERLNEAASRAWNECQAAWRTFRQRLERLSASDAGTTLTRDEWLLPLFQELGYGRLQTKTAITIDQREYPVSHGWENHVPIHLISARYPLDRRTSGVAGAATRSPYSMVQELLNRSVQHRWGFVSNGLRLYLLRDNAALARAANVEFDLEAMMDGEVYADFVLLFLLCHQSRVEMPPDGKPEDCWLEKWANQADQQGTRAREKLRDGVEAAIKALGAGFLTTRGNNPLRDRLRSGELSTQDYYRQLLRLVYRLLMLLVAEEKKTESGENLLHPPGTPADVRERFARYYSASRIRTLTYQRRGTAHPDLYESLKVLFLKLREGYSPLGIPGMGSFLFSDDSTPDLDGAALANQDLLDTFRRLCYTEDTSGRGGAVRRPVDFGNLGSEELGSVYESLLELHPQIDTDEGPFTLGTAAGNERKTTGSYYTPTSLINCLLDSALDPVVNAAIDEAERMVNGEWRMVAAKYKEGFAAYAYRRLSGFAGLATWKADRQSDLSADSRVSEGRTVHSVSSDRKRKPDGTGDPSDDLYRRGTVQLSGRAATSGGIDGAGKATCEPGAKSEEAGTWRLANMEVGEWKIANREWDQQLEKLWNETPLTTRHSLFAERALLDLKVCDPACGSGHFLIAAAERMAMHLARLRTGDDQPTTIDIQHAKRDIIGRCIYGVDINPMAVELCKISLWMEALEPGKPLSFLDHHIQCGNSLLGATPALLAKGIPDDAFKPIEGDDKAICSELKKDNKRQRQEYESGQGYLFDTPYKLGTLPASFARLSTGVDDSVADVAEKERRFAELVSQEHYQNARLLADTWCAVFVWRKDASDLGKLCPTERDFRKIEDNPQSIQPHVKSEVRRLADQYQFFHWHLAFPDVFRLPGGSEEVESKEAGWNNGFDVMLGNPPYGASMTKHARHMLNTQHTDAKPVSNSAADFMAISRGQLQQNGLLGFVVPKSLTYSFDWRLMRESVLPFARSIVDASQAWKEVLLEQVLVCFGRTRAETTSAGAFDASGIAVVAKLNRVAAEKLGIIPTGLDATSNTLLNIILDNSSKTLGDYCTTQRGTGLQRHARHEGPLPLIAGKNISSFEMRPIERYLDPDADEIDASRIRMVLPPQAIFQNIVAHIKNPQPHIRLIGTVCNEPNACLDTVNLLTPIEGSTANPFFLAGLLMSDLINWFVYVCIYNRAIRTMHFDGYFLDKIPTPDETTFSTISTAASRLATAPESLDLWHQLNQAVFAAYGINTAIATTVSAMHKPRVA